MSQRQSLRFEMQPQRIVRVTQRMLLGIVWGMMPVLLLQSYLRYGEVRSSTIFACALVAILAGIMAAVRPRQVVTDTYPATMTADEAGIHWEGGRYPIPFLPWSEIADLQPRRFLGFDLMLIVPTNPASLKTRLGMYWYNNRWPGGVALVVSAFGEAHEVVAQINDFRRENGV